jgi:hypothetical protein
VSYSAAQRVRARRVREILRARTETAALGEALGAAPRGEWRRRCPDALTLSRTGG